jgi:hypothetical protein
VMKPSTSFSNVRDASYCIGGICADTGGGGGGVEMIPVMPLWLVISNSESYVGPGLCYLRTVEQAMFLQTMQTNVPRFSARSLWLALTSDSSFVRGCSLFLGGVLGSDEAA